MHTGINFLRVFFSYDYVQNERDQILTTNGWIIFTWKDELLTWNPANYGYAELIILPAKELWLPELTPINR